MILKKYDSKLAYRPLDVFTLDALLYLAYTKQWAIEELTPLQFMPLQLTPYRFVFASFYTPEPYWGAGVRASWDIPTTTKVDYEEVDLEHIAFGGAYYIHWRVGWRPSTKSLVVGLTKDNEYVQLERR